MGRTVVRFTLSNSRDLDAVDEGRLAPEKVRKVEMDGVVDTGAARLILPSGVAAVLGLTPDGQSTVRYADHRRERRDVVRDAHVHLQGRGGVFKAVLEPARTDALLGAIVLEDLDFLVDSTAQRLVPRDPDTLVTEAE